MRYRVQYVTSKSMFYKEDMIKEKRFDTLMQVMKFVKEMQQCALSEYKIFYILSLQDVIAQEHILL